MKSNRLDLDRERLKSLMPIKNSSLKLVVKYVVTNEGELRMFTDDLKYGDNLEVVFDKKQQTYTVKNLEKLRKQWNETHAESVESTIELESFCEGDVL